MGNVGGNTSLPARYYDIQVIHGTDSYHVFRRYSEFRWLYKRLVNYPPPINTDPLFYSASTEALMELPPRSYYCYSFFENDEFLEDRQNDLYEFLKDALERPSFVSHPAMIEFLLLDFIMEKQDEFRPEKKRVMGNGANTQFIPVNRNCNRYHSFGPRPMARPFIRRGRVARAMAFRGRR